MANIISWGKPKVEIVECSENGYIPSSSPQWKALPTPVENSSKLDTQEGDKKEAKIEGGEVIASRQDASKFVFECELYETDDFQEPIEQANGVVTKYYAVRLTPEQSGAKGFLMERTSVVVQKTWSAETGGKIKYIFTALKPKTGEMLKPHSA
ncbi:hypothetical protein ACIRNY_11105 [Capnocytophaga canimorsus]|uniref:hypothetical protein n=1 Tax=Capnocytophaga canimorsus TaxID=28188 RepID=UPI00384CD1C3